MPKLTYRIENAPGKIYGKNSNELVFKEPSSDALIYSTATDSGLLKNTKKHLYRGPPSEKEGGVSVATIDEPSHGTLEMHHHHRDGKDEVASTKLKLKKSSSWVPFSGKNNHGLTFRDAAYTWGGKSQLKRDKDGRVMAKTVGPWFWQGKLGDLEVDIPEMGDEDERRDLLEMVLATFVLRWWGDKVVEEERAREAKKRAQIQKKERQDQKKAVAKQKKDKDKDKDKKEEEEVEGDGGQGEQQTASGP